MKGIIYILKQGMILKRVMIKFKKVIVVKWVKIMSKHQLLRVMKLIKHPIIINSEYGVLLKEKMTNFKHHLLQLRELKHPLLQLLIIWIWKTLLIRFKHHLKFNFKKLFLILIIMDLVGKKALKVKTVEGIVRNYLTMMIVTLYLMRITE